MKQIQIFYFDAGGGHRAAARALKMVIEREQRPWQVELINLQELLLAADVVYKVTHVPTQEVYNKLLEKGATELIRPLKGALHAAIRFLRPTHVRMLRKFWRQHPADLVVSVIPNLNATLYQALQAELPGVPYVTILTDLADYPPHFWMEPQDQYVICGTERAVEQAVETGIAENRIFLVSGMILHPRFYEPPARSRGQERVELAPEFSAQVTTGIVLFGGHGSPAMLEIARQLDRVRGELQAFFLCGRNEELAWRLSQMQTRYRKQVEGFTDEVPRFMHASDFFIGKPGPGSVSEALQMKLPVIVECNRKTMPQERYNAVWIREKGVGIVLKDFKELPGAVERLLGAEGKEFSARVEQTRNRAVFEIPPILEEILARGMN